MEKLPTPILGTGPSLDQIARMQALLSENDYGDLGMWNDLCAKHVRLIREHGFESFKRTINFEYHQWAVRSLVDVKSLKLVATLLRSARLPHAAVKARMNVADALDTEWTKGGVTKQSLRAYRAYVGLLWDFASSEDELGLLRRFDVGSPGTELEFAL